MSKTKKLLEEALWELLNEKPFSKITVKDIADRCHVNRNTFYYHFQDIPYLLEVTLQDWFDEQISTHYIPGKPFDSLIPIIAAFKEKHNAVKHIYKSIHKEEFIRSLDRTCTHVSSLYLEKRIEEARQSGSDNNPVNLSGEDIQFLTRFYKYIMIGFIVDWLDQDMNDDILESISKLNTIYQGDGLEGIRILSAKNNLRTSDPETLIRAAFKP